jgi:hypothetical protein
VVPSDDTTSAVPTNIQEPEAEEEEKKKKEKEMEEMMEHKSFTAEEDAAALTWIIAPPYKIANHVLTQDFYPNLRSAKLAMQQITSAHEAVRIAALAAMSARNTSLQIIGFIQGTIRQMRQQQEEQAARERQLLRTVGTMREQALVEPTQPRNAIQIYADFLDHTAGTYDTLPPLVNVLVNVLLL